MTREILDRFEEVLRHRLPLIQDLPPPNFDMPSDDVLRRLMSFSASVEPYLPPFVPTIDLQIDGPHGRIPVRRYDPPDEPVGGIVWVHGGAFAFGDLEGPEADVVSRELCARTGSIVVSVDYRLATNGVRYPVPHDDVHAAWLWASGPDGPPSGDRPWLLGGASAGANLALGVAMRLRDQARPLPGGLLLAYPLAHFVVPAPDPELRQLMDVLPARMRFTTEHIAEINGNYVGPGREPGPYAMPGDGDLHALPPTQIVLSEFDDLRPSGERLAEDLRAAGGTAQVILERGAPHGHLSIPGLPSALRSLEAMAVFARDRAR